MVTRDKLTAKQQQLDLIKQRIIDDRVTPDLARQATQLVFADGSADADIVFIGEAPGKNEDLQGKPFVGAAGRFLDEMLAMIGLQRSDIYITNIVKYRPPDNRDPYPEEKSAFLPYLESQLEVIQPKLVVTLGRHSLNCFLPDLQISQVHGQPSRFRFQFHRRSGGQSASAMQGAGVQRTEAVQKGTAKGAADPTTELRAANDGGVTNLAGQLAGMTLVILPLFHPAAALYNGGMRQTLIDDFALIPAILQKITKETD